MQQDSLGMESLVKVANQTGLSMQRDVLLGMFEGTKGRSRLEPPTAFETLAEALQNATLDPTEQDKLKRLKTIFGDGIAREQLEAIVNDPSQEGSSRRDALLSLYATKSDGTLHSRRNTFETWPSKQPQSR